jgi:RimJ/RimL family protein N-acetyltransferase
LFLCEFIKYPTAWENIAQYLIDDYGDLETDGNFVGVFSDEEMAGAFQLVPWNTYCFELRGGVDKKYWGNGVEVCGAAGRFLFDKTQCLKIVVVVPVYKKPMIRCLKAVGMTEEGILKKSYLKWSKLHDQLIYGLCKGDATWQQQVR